VASVSTVSGTFELDVHGFDLDDPVMLRAEAGGSLPSPLLEHVEYYAFPVTESTFRVKGTTGSGEPLTLTTQGERIVAIAPLPIAAAISYASALLEEMTPAHARGALETSRTARVICATIAAGKLMSRRGPMTKSLADLVKDAQKQLDRWAKGVPVRDSPLTGRTNLAAAVARPGDPRGYGGSGGIC
jgi:antitoxin (DNA-binding transcriptional repressor) of toxin-antitoxin stability system